MLMEVHKPTCTKMVPIRWLNFVKPEKLYLLNILHFSMNHCTVYLSISLSNLYMRLLPHGPCLLPRSFYLSEIRSSAGLCYIWAI